MSKLWILLAVSLVLAFVIDHRDYQLGQGREKTKERAVTICLILLLGLFCGLRLWGNDTATYRIMYQQIPLWDKFLVNNKYDFAAGIGFGTVTSLLKTWGFSEQDYLMFYAFATVIPYVLFVRRFCTSMSFGVFLMFVTGFYVFSLAAVKQCAATALCLCAIPFALENKWLRFFLFVLLGALFHPYALVYLLVPLLMFKPLTFPTYTYIVVFVSVGFFLESLLGTVINVTDMMGAEYSLEEFTEEGVNFFRFLVCAVPMLLAMVYGEPMFRNAGKQDYLMFNMAMVNALIMFVGMFGTANYFGRLANYFLPAQVIIIPWQLKRVHPEDRKWMVPLCVVAYLGYFFYENGILRPFDTYYAHISLWDYLSELFG